MPQRPGDLLLRKQAGLPITILTAWDALSAAMVSEAGADAVLVGDSLAMTALGHATTLPVTLEEMLHHCRAVGRGLRRVGGEAPLLICDLPFLSYQCGLDDAVAAAGRVLKESPASAVKMEGAEPEILEAADRMVRMGIPVMGHLGLLPQSVHRLGLRRQATDPLSQERLQQQALALEAKGCFALVVEHIPDTLAMELCQRLTIPVIGIGAGDRCDGQVRVTADLLGFTDRQPPFSPPLLDGRGLAVEALRGWIRQQGHRARSVAPSPSTTPESPAAPSC
ncbi:MAG: 3-methyl-2-oxobutanoate hydroxymethyltransferase [Cyanobium sp.]